MIHIPDSSSRFRGPAEGSLYDRHLHLPAGGNAGAEAQANPLHAAHLVMRGRYPWAILLFILFAAGGVYAGLKLANVAYRSRATLIVRPTLKEIQKDVSEDKHMMPMFDNYVQAQANMMMGERVRNKAMRNDEWLKLGKGNSEKEILEFVKSLKVTHENGMVFVDMVDHDTDVARGGTKALVKSFMEIYDESESKVDGERMSILESDRNRQQSEYESAMARVAELASLSGVDNLEKRYEMQGKLIERYAQEIDEINKILMLTATTRPSMDMKSNDYKDPSVEEIAKTDAHVSQLLIQKVGIEATLTAMHTAGIGEEHPRMKNTRAQLEEVTTQLAVAAERFRKGLALSENPSLNKNLWIAQQKNRLEQLKEMKSAAHEEWLVLGKWDVKLEKFRGEANSAKARLDKTSERINDLKTEQRLSRRIDVLSDGDVSPEAFQDDRVRFASVGGIGAGLLGFGLVMGLALMDRSLRYADDAVSRFSSIPMLGILPELPLQSTDPDQAALVSHCVHQIRGLLQIQGSAKSSHVFSITSPVAGTGKTTLTHALGVSFAHAGSRTLLIDCDMVGGGLSARIDATIRRRLGRILRREGRITPDQLTQALKLAIGAKKPLGEMLMELGTIDQADLARALALQDQEPMGLMDAINGEDIRECVGETGVPGLSVLPLGLACSENVSQLSPSVIRGIIDQARRKYDTVLVDTGPIPGSLEAAVVAAAVDGVILAVSRGEQRPLAEQCLQHLNHIGARVVGLVFNRAGRREVYASGTKYLSSTQLLLGSRRSERVSRNSEGSRISPVVTAVATRVPNGKNGTASRQSQL